MRSGERIELLGKWGETYSVPTRVVPVEHKEEGVCVCVCVCVCLQVSRLCVCCDCVIFSVGLPVCAQQN